MPAPRCFQLARQVVERLPNLDFRSRARINRKNPLFQVALACQNNTEPAPVLPGLRVEVRPLLVDTAKFDSRWTSARS